MIRIALAQIKIREKIEENLMTVLATLQEAAEKNVDIVLFPESALTGYLGSERNYLTDLDPVVVHQAIFRIKEECARLSIGCLVGQYFKRCGVWYNNAVAIGKQGELLASYDKLQLVDRDCYEVAPGDQLAVFMFDGVRCSMAICHDIRYPEVLREYGSRGVQVHFHLFYGVREVGAQAIHYQEQYNAHLITRAVENGFYLVATNVAVQNEQMVRSQIRDWEGRSVAMAKNAGTELVIAEINPSDAGDGWAMKRRYDLFPGMKQKETPRSYFERGVWDTKRYMIHHVKAES